MEVISVIIQKGGTGKTTTALNLGAVLRQKGFKTLYIDLDAQCNLTYLVTERMQDKGIFECFSRMSDLESAIQKTPKGDIVASSEKLSGIDAILTQTGKEYRLRELLEPIKDKYDYVIIDTPPTLNVLTVNALTVSDSVIIPVQADVLSLQGLGQLYQTIQAVKTYTNPKLNIKGILITRYNGRSILTKELTKMLTQTASELGTKLFKTQIREAVAVKESQINLQSVVEYAPNSNASIDYKNFTMEVINNG